MKTIKVNSFFEIPENFTGIAVFSDGANRWFKNGKQHRENRPAVEFLNGYKEWWNNGEPHREDGPALEFANGDKSWYKEGKRHREDGPACESISGYKEWHLEGKRYDRINLQNHVVLDSYQGKHNLMWYKLLDENKIFEYPDIPGLITK